MKCRTQTVKTRYSSSRKIDNIFLQITKSLGISIITSRGWNDFTEWRGDPMFTIIADSKIYEIDASYFKQILKTTFKKNIVGQMVQDE